MMMNWVGKRTDTTNRINTAVGEIIFNGICQESDAPVQSCFLTRDICALPH